MLVLYLCYACLHILVHMPAVIESKLAHLKGNLLIEEENS